MSLYMNLMFPDPSGQASSTTQDISVAGLISDANLGDLKIGAYYNVWPNYNTDIDKSTGLLYGVSTHPDVPQSPPLWRYPLIDDGSGNLVEFFQNPDYNTINNNPTLMDQLAESSSLISSGLSSTTYGRQSLSFSLDALSLPVNYLFGSKDLEPDPTGMYDRKIYVVFYAYRENSYVDNTGVTRVTRVVDSGFGSADTNNRYVLNIVRKQDWYSSLAPQPTGLYTDVTPISSIVYADRPAMSDQDGYIAGMNIYASTGPGKPVSRVNISTATEVEVQKKESVLLHEEYENYGLTLSTDTLSRTTSEKLKYEISKSAYQDLVSTVYGVSDINGRETAPLFFSVSYVVYSAQLGLFVEGPRSIEFEGKAVPILSTYTPVTRSQNSIISTFIKSMGQKGSGMSMVPGTVVRDTLDPVADQFARHYVVQDFNSVRTSLPALISFDDPTGQGYSSDPASTLNKVLLSDATGLSSSEVQSMVDEAFDMLAGNYGMNRLDGSSARGLVVVSATNIPSTGLTIPTGTKISSRYGVIYITVEPKVITSSSAPFFRNASDTRYEFEIEVISMNSGSLGNCAVGNINEFYDTQYSSLSVTNKEPIVGGTDLEGNIDLAARVLFAISGVDSGRRDGYMKNVLSVPNVRQSVVIRSGDHLMLRDVGKDGEHYGGCVDIYVRGSEPQVYSENFAINVGEGGLSKNEKFTVSVPEALRFKTNNPYINSKNPIIRVNAVYNVTRSAYYDLNGVMLGMGEGDSFQLSQTSANLAIGAAANDIIDVQFYHLGSDLISLNHHPVADDGTLSFSFNTQQVISNKLVPSIELIKDVDPALYGNSSKAFDKVQVTFSEQFFNQNQGIDLVESTINEKHLVSVSVPVTLNYKGVDTNSIVVMSQDLSYTYILDVDYYISNDVSGSTLIYMKSGSRVKSGSVVSLNYKHSLNVAITYKTNGCISSAQDHIDRMSHMQAGVLVKEAIRNIVDVNFGVKFNDGVDITGFDQPNNFLRMKLINTVRAKISAKPIGGSVDMDELLSSVRDLPEVRRVVLPITRMRRRSGSTIMLEEVGVTTWRVLYQDKFTSNTAYITNNPVLQYPCMEGGSPVGKYCGVYESDIPLKRATSESNVSSDVGNFYIRGDGRIVVTTFDGGSPDGLNYRASYQTLYSDTDRVASDLVAGPLEYFETDTNSVVITIEA